LEVAEQERVIRGEPTEEEEDARIDKEFIIGEMLKVAVHLDYADEIGRRKMFQLVRDMISQETLPESLVSRCLDVLRMLSPNERDLIRVVVEVVHELRDVGDEDEAVVRARCFFDVCLYSVQHWLLTRRNLQTTERRILAKPQCHLA
jgi:condensin complex subunit 3